jgi:hypothetical protein
MMVSPTLGCRAIAFQSWFSWNHSIKVQDKEEGRSISSAGGIALPLDLPWEMTVQHCHMRRVEPEIPHESQEQTCPLSRPEQGRIPGSDLRLSWLAGEGSGDGRAREEGGKSWMEGSGSRTHWRTLCLNFTLKTTFSKDWLRTCQYFKIPKFYCSHLLMPPRSITLNCRWSPSGYGEGLHI